MQLTKQTLTIDNHEIVCDYVIKEKNVVILHGAGASNRARYRLFAEEILKHGYGVVLFDFMGHGESSGELQNSSLSNRQYYALKVIQALLPKDSSFILVGFSMSGETVCNLLPLFPRRIKTILLGCPALYTKDAADLQFKSDEFKTRIRTTNSWKNSNGLKNIAHFTGKTFIAYGNKDEVIPKEVIEALKVAAQRAIYKEYDASHALAVWLGEHPKKLEKLITELLSADSKAP